jgi:hypothetical protein
VKRHERRLFRVADELARLRREEELVAGELELQRHVTDDVVRDAAVADAPAERAEAREATKNRDRLELALADVRRRIGQTETRRAELLQRLGES